MRSQRVWNYAVVILSAAVLSGCVPLTLAWTSLEPRGAPATPPVFEAADIQRADHWREQRTPEIRNALERHVIGAMPEASTTRVLKKRIIDEAAFGGRGRLEEWTLSATATFGGVPVETLEFMDSGGFLVQVVIPNNRSAPAPLIMMETFCPSWDAVPHEGVSKPEDANSMSGGFFGVVATYVFGRFICTPPYEEILDRGYAVASFFPDPVAPDVAEAGLAELRRLSVSYEDDDTRWGAVAAWAWLYSRLTDVFEGDERFDRDGFIAWGHSRYGKAALYAAAFDERIDGVIAHQSGTGGASLNRDKPGESVEAMTETYPHWFAQSYADAAGHEDELPIDQHHLLALVAPRPILLGNARRDVWSDPNGAFRAAMGADPVWELLGADGLEQDRLDQWIPSADIAFWIRPGTHGVVEEDWPAFLEFLDAHFKPVTSDAVRG